MRGDNNFPEVMIAEYKEELKCTHGREYVRSNDNLYRESDRIVIYSELGEKVFNIPVYARRSSGSCKCLQRVDGTDFLIWNLGQGRFIDFPLFHSYLQKYSQ